MKQGHRKKRKGKKHSKGYIIPLKTEPEHPLRVATKRAQNWGRIIDALPNDELKQLALAEYKKLGDKL